MLTIPLKRTFVVLCIIILFPLFPQKSFAQLTTEEKIGLGIGAVVTGGVLYWIFSGDDFKELKKKADEVDRYFDYIMTNKRNELNVKQTGDISLLYVLMRDIKVKVDENKIEKSEIKSALKALNEIEQEARAIVD